MCKNRVVRIVCIIIAITLLLSGLHANAVSINSEPIPDVQRERQFLIEKLISIQMNDEFDTETKLSHIVNILFEAKRNQLVNNMMDSFDFDEFWAEEKNQDNIDYFVRSLELEKETFFDLKISLMYSTTDLVFQT